MYLPMTVEAARLVLRMRERFGRYSDEAVRRAREVLATGQAIHQDCLGNRVERSAA